LTLGTASRMYFCICGCRSVTTASGNRPVLCKNWRLLARPSFSMRGLPPTSLLCAQTSSQTLHILQFRLNSAPILRCIHYKLLVHLLMRTIAFVIHAHPSLAGASTGTCVSSMQPTTFGILYFLTESQQLHNNTVHLHCPPASVCCFASCVYCWSGDPWHETACGHGQTHASKYCIWQSEEPIELVLYSQVTLESASPTHMTVELLDCDVIPYCHMYQQGRLYGLM